MPYRATGRLLAYRTYFSRRSLKVYIIMMYTSRMDDVYQLPTQTPNNSNAEVMLILNHGSKVTNGISKNSYIISMYEYTYCSPKYPIRDVHAY